jgi:hypothetical protein
MCTKNGREMWDILNQWIEMSPIFPGKQPLSKDYVLICAGDMVFLTAVAIFKGNCFSQPGMALASSLTGSEMASVLQVLEISLLGLIEDELKCWKQHIDIIDVLKWPGFSEVDLA